MDEKDFDNFRSRQFGYAVTLRRTALQMDRKRLAVAAELSYPYICEIEKGMKDPSAKSLRSLASALGFATPTDLLRWVDEHPMPEDADKKESVEAAEPDMQFRRGWGRAAADVSNMPARRMSLQGIAATPSLANNEIEQLREVILSTVKLEISSWLRNELPLLVRDEVARQFEERGL